MSFEVILGDGGTVWSLWTLEPTTVFTVRVERVLAADILNDVV